MQSKLDEVLFFSLTFTQIRDIILQKKILNDLIVEKLFSSGTRVVRGTCGSNNIRTLYGVSNFLPRQRHGYRYGHLLH